MDQDRMLASMSFYRACSNLGITNSFLGVMSKFLSGEARVLSWEKEGIKFSSEDFIFVRDYNESQLRNKLMELDGAINNMTPGLRRDLFVDENYRFSPREAHLTMMEGIRQRRSVKSDDVVFKFQDRVYFLEDNLDKGDGYDVVRNNLYEIYNSVVNYLDEGRGEEPDFWDISKKIDRTLHSSLIVFLRADTILKDFESRLEREDYRFKF